MDTYVLIKRLSSSSTYRALATLTLLLRVKLIELT